MPSPAALTVQERRPRAGRGEAAVPPVSFVRASRQRTEPADDRSFTLGAGAIAAPPIDIPPIGFLRHVVVRVTATGGAAGAATVAAAPDAPFSVFDSLSVADVNGNPIFHPMRGFYAYLAEKYGAYAFISDPKQRESYAGVDSAGNFDFTLRIPLEASERDGLGALANMSASQTYKLNYTIAPSSAVYTTAPNTLPSVRVRAWIEVWAPPTAQSAVTGAPQLTSPPAHGTTQRWSLQTYNVSAGDQRIQLTRVGNLIRNIVVVARTSAGARDTAMFPDPVRVEYDGNLVEQVYRQWLRDRMRERYGFTGAVGAAGGLDVGVFAWDFCHELDGKPGYEQRDMYLPTTQGTRLEITGNFGAAGTLYVLTNDLAVPAAVVGAAAGENATA